MVEAIGVSGASAEAYAGLRTSLDEALGSTDAAQVGDDLFTVAGLLRSEPALRRVATDAAIDASAKQGLLRGLLEGKVAPAALSVVEQAVGKRWTATRDLADSLEALSQIAVVKSAATDVERLSDELFAFEEVVAGDPALRDALSNPQRSVEDKSGLVDALLAGKALPATVTLAKQGLAGSYRTFENALSVYQKVAAAEQRQRVAEVRVARDLTPTDRARLQTALTQQYGRAMHLNVVVDPSLIGGLRVTVGDDVIDGSVVARLDDARRRLAG